MPIVVTDVPGILLLSTGMTESQNDTRRVLNASTGGHHFSTLDDIDVTADASPVLRILISIVYSVVCAAGLVGNLLVFFLMKTKQGCKKSTINFFILNLAVTDFQFVLTLPFWAVDTALDFSWPFGVAMCKIVLSVTVMNMYASVFFLTAMSIARYWLVTSALKNRNRRLPCSVRWVCMLLWVSATVATAPTTLFSTVDNVAGEKLCLLRFPKGQNWLALNHLQKIMIAFVLPMAILSICYLLLVRFLRQQSTNNNNPKRRSSVTRSVTVVVLSYFLCWMPNQALTFWGVLVKFSAVPWDKAYYLVHTYVFPVTVCLAHANSCLNPILYCLMRREFRKILRGLFWRISPPVNSNTCPLRQFSESFNPAQYDTQGVIPVNVTGIDPGRVSSPLHGACNTVPSSSTFMQI